MIEIDTHWMAVSAKTLFDEAVRTYAEAIRLGSMPGMQSAERLMRQACQAQIVAQEHADEPKAADPEI